MSLNTKGTPLVITAGQSRRVRPKPKISLEDLTKLQTKIQCSDNKLKEIGHFIRVGMGKESVVSHLGENLTLRNHSWDKFKLVDIEVEMKKKKNNDKKEISKGEDNKIELSGEKEKNNKRKEKKT